MQFAELRWNDRMVIGLRIGNAVFFVIIAGMYQCSQSSWQPAGITTLFRASTNKSAPPPLACRLADLPSSSRRGNRPRRFPRSFVPIEPLYFLAGPPFSFVAARPRSVGLERSRDRDTCFSRARVALASTSRKRIYRVLSDSCTSRSPSNGGTTSDQTRHTH